MSGYRLNSPPVVLETVDEETIIVNLDTGCYYDLNHSGGRFLAALAAGLGPDQAVAAVAAAYGVEAEELAPAGRDLVTDLLKEEILIEGAPVEAANGDGASPPSRPYEPPRLGKHTDMQELLLLDPIHEVNDAGWPNRA